MKKTKDENKKGAKAMAADPADGKAAAASFLEDLLSTAKGGERRHCPDETAKDPLGEIADAIASAFGKAKAAGLPIEAEIGAGFSERGCLGKARDGGGEEAGDPMDGGSPHDRLGKAIRSPSPEEALHGMASADAEILSDARIPELERTLCRLGGRLPIEASYAARAYLEALLNLREKAEKLSASIGVLMADGEEEGEGERRRRRGRADARPLNAAEGKGEWHA